MREEEAGLSFQKIKEDMSILNTGLSSLKEALLIQNQVLLALLKRIDLLEQIDKKAVINNSTGNDGVNQSINHLNTSEFNTINNHENSLFIAEYGSSTGNDGVKERVSYIKTGKEADFEPKKGKEERNDVFRMAKDKIDTIFNSLSKQELKVFLTTYQLEDEHQETSYRVIAERMDLSEHCIRAHICALFRKKAPLYKVKLNNKMTLIFVDKDFKSLNLKQKLINLYYKADPLQSTLFDLYH